ncbi:MAG: outer membrane beta-barrel protein [Gemmataceae bacterium]|nr:outer membrane beta-barrel protein [Gemmataceae bacterium]
MIRAVRSTCWGLVVWAVLALAVRAAGQTAAPTPQAGGAFTMTAPAAMTLESGQEAMLALHFQRDRFSGVIEVSFPGLPAGVTVAPASLPSPDGQGRVVPGDRKSWRGVVRAAPGTTPRTVQITVHARSGALRKEAEFPITITRPSSPAAARAPETTDSNDPGRLDPSVAILPPLTVRLPPEPVVLTAPFAPPPAPAPEPAPAAPAATSDRYALMKALQGTALGDALDGSRLRLYGWLDVSYTASSVAHNQLPLGFNYLANNFLLQQNWIRFERTVVTSGTTEPTFGFRGDLILPGADYRFTLPRGLFSGQLTANDGLPNTYGIDPISFYVEGYFPTVGRGLDVKVGHFWAQVGVEANDAPSNALFSHSYTFIYNPFTHTGALATLKLTDAWTVYGGLVLGSDVFIDPAAEPTFMGGVKWASPQGRDTVAFNVMLCDGRFNVAEQFYNPNLFELVWTHRLNARLLYTFHTAYAYQTGVPDLGFIWSLGFVNYLTYDFTPRLSGTTRLEFYEDAQGQRTGFRGLYSALTAGLTFKPYRFLVIRPELRYDYNSDSRPFQNNHGLFTASSDVIIRW